MPTNQVFEYADRLSVAPTNPLVVVNEGDPVRYGFATGVALTVEGAGGNAAGVCTVDFGMRVWSLPVTDGVGGGIAAGDALFYADGVPGSITNVSAGNYFFGFAKGAVGAGLTATIEVIHIPSPGAGTLGAGTIATANLANGILSADVAGRAKMAAGFLTGDKLAANVVRISLAAGTGIGANVNLAAIAVGDAIVSVLSFTTAAAIASVADRTAEYAAGAGVLTKAAGTDETNNQLVIVWIDKT